MAKDQENKKQENNEKKPNKILPWIILLLVVGLACGGGFFAGGFVAEVQNKTNEPNSVENEKVHEVIQQAKAVDASDSKDVWYYELDPVVATLNEPDGTRLCRVALILEVSGKLKKVDGEKFFKEKQPLIINWLTIYFSDLEVEDTLGEKNRNRILFQIKDAFNRKFFPEAAPMIKSVLFKEFATQ